ncbi:hypothetical protein K2173_013653 [Erythroxylum novogranatense]|uniref:BHLH domain-containing protein n=1 Tax=Erythroxylum novogranatense TaxID=1862640 RepID=A0AAV8TK47_9ROSI|nr:hypothetical protein K2173_013653 [Erythroxylum novogranatense]
MGNALRFLCGHSSVSDDSGSLGPHGVSTTTVGVSALAHHLFNFEITSQVPEGLSSHVISPKRAQDNWYRKLSEAWREAKPPPKTPEEASTLIIRTLKGHPNADVEGLLGFYGLPLPHTLHELSAAVPTSLPKGVKLELQTPPVGAKAIPDGDTITVYFSTTDSRESSCVPHEVQMAAERNYAKADALHKQIIDSGYRLPAVLETATTDKHRDSVASEKFSSVVDRESVKKVHNNNTKVAPEDETGEKRATGGEEQEEESKNKDKNTSKNSRENSVETSKDNSKVTEVQKPDYIHVRARRGRATDSHSLAERVRREKISERMKYLQDLVPGCNKVTGKAVMLDEIINYVQSLQRQVEAFHASGASFPTTEMSSVGSYGSYLVTSKSSACEE